jgi:hypothetical protein
VSVLVTPLALRGLDLREPAGCARPPRRSHLVRFGWVALGAVLASSVGGSVNNSRGSSGSTGSTRGAGTTGTDTSASTTATTSAGSTGTASTSAGSNGTNTSSAGSTGSTGTSSTSAGPTGGTGGLLCTPAVEGSGVPLVGTGVTSPSAKRVDLNRDGKRDALTVDGSTLSVLLGHGDDTFANRSTFDVSSSQTPRDLAVGEFTGDASLDMAVGDSYRSGRVTVLRGALADRLLALKAPGGLIRPLLDFTRADQ